MELDAGTSEIEVNGKTVESKQLQVGNAVTVAGGDVVARVSGPETTPADSGGSGITLASGESAQLSLQGLRPDSEVRVVIFSEPRQLAVLTVDSMGGFFASIEIPTDLESGSHTLVLSGLDKDGLPIDLRFGLFVYSNTTTLMPLWIWSTMALLIFALVGGVIWTRKVKRENSEFWQARLRGGTV